MNVWYRAGYNLSKLIARAMFSFRVVHPERVIETARGASASAVEAANLIK